MSGKVLDDFTGEAVLTNAEGDVLAHLLFDRSAVKALDGMVARGASGLLVQPPSTMTECGIMVMVGTAGYQRRNPGTKRVTDNDQAWDIVRDAGGPLHKHVVGTLVESLSCAEDLGLRNVPVDTGDADPLARGSSSRP